MRLRLAILVAALQVLVLGFMAGEREWALHAGRLVTLRSAPIDPNDPMRGEYARLGYEISILGREYWRDGLPDFVKKNADGRAGRDLRVYTSVHIDETGLAEPISVSDRAPTSGLFLRGRIESMSTERITVRYGIEALFMQQGRAAKLEEDRRGEHAGVPLDVDVAVASSGLTVLRDHRWENLGITVTLERGPTAPVANISPVGTRPNAVVAITVVLKNHGQKDLAIVDLPDAGSFRLVPVESWQENHYRWVGSDKHDESALPENVIVLKPGGTNTTRLDLARPEWFVVDTRLEPAKQKPLSLLQVRDPWAARFRVEYAAPPASAVTGFPGADLIQRGRLRSRGFNVTGNVD